MAIDKSQASMTPPAVSPDQLVPQAPAASTTTPAVPAAAPVGASTSGTTVSTVTNPILYNSMPYYGLAYPNYAQSSYAYPRIYQVNDPNVREVMPEIYRPQTFDSDKMFRAMYGSEASRRDKRKFRRYLKSDQYRADVDRFNSEENRKYLASIDAREAYRQRMWEDRMAGTSTEQKKSKYNFTQSAKWDNLAKKYGFADREALANWQAANGLVADGKFGNKSLVVWNRLNGISGGSNRSSSGGGSSYNGSSKGGSSSSSGSSSSTSSKSSTNSTKKSNSTSKVGQYENDKQWHSRMKSLGMEAIRMSDGTTKYRNRMTGETYYNNGRMETNSGKLKSYNPYEVSSPSTARANSARGDSNAGKTLWHNTMKRKGFTKKTMNDGSIAYEDSHGNTFYDNGRVRYSNGHMSNYDYAKMAQGGVLNRINYYQQGGAVPQDPREQIVQLVQAAMQGDKKATQQVQQIMQAAEQGNPEAVQLAQMIQEVAKQLQGQAQAAKYGTKLKYIKSLKAAKGCRVKKH